jgi:hypothetical protein
VGDSRDAVSREEAFNEIGEGKTFQKTKKKHGTKTANKQRVAIYLSKARRGEYGKKAKRKAGKGK